MNKVCGECGFFVPVDVDWMIGKCRHPRGFFRVKTFDEKKCNCWKEQTKIEETK